MFDALRPFAYLAFAVIWLGLWIGGYVTLFRRYSATMRAYLRRFPPVAGVPLGTQLGEGLGWSRVGAHQRALWQVTVHPQADPDLERHRREVWRRSRHLLLWHLGFFVPTLGAWVLLTGLVHP